MSIINNQKQNVCDTGATSESTKYVCLEVVSDSDPDYDPRELNEFNELLFNHLTQNKWMLNSSQKSQL